MDDLCPSDRVRLGLVVPKRHAKRSVTRSLVKREMRSAWGRHAHLLLPGDWLLRQRAPFAPAEFPSGASVALRQAVRAELEALFADLARRAAPAPEAST